MAFVNNLSDEYLSFLTKRPLRHTFSTPSVQRHERFVHGLFSLPAKMQAKKHPPLSPIGQKSGC